MEENVQFDKKSLKLVTGKTANFGELAKDCVAFANTYGGYLAIGIEDEMDMPSPNQVIPENLPEKVIKRLNELDNLVSDEAGVVRHSHTNDNNIFNLQIDNLQCTIYLLFGYFMLSPKRWFSLYYPNTIRDNGQRKNTFLGICRGSEGVLSLIYPMLIPYASFGQVPMRFQSDSNEVPMEVRGD